jgi:hypothetical protein
VFQLKPTAQDWLLWAEREGIHPSILRYIAMFPERLWDEENINPNPRGWHQFSRAFAGSYRIGTEQELLDHLASDPGGSLESIIHSLVGHVAGADFIAQLTAPRALSTAEVLAGNEEKLARMIDGSIPSEDILWALSGAVRTMRDLKLQRKGDLDRRDLAGLANLLLFIGSARADLRLSFFYLLLRDCGIFTQVPAAIGLIPEEERRRSLLEKFNSIVESDNE